MISLYGYDINKENKYKNFVKFYIFNGLFPTIIYKGLAKVQRYPPTEIPDPYCVHVGIIQMIKLLP